MDEIKIWAVDGKQASPVEPVDGMSLERDFEDILVNKPELLMPGLRLVGRQMPTGSGPLDLLGVDEDGKLVVFELKRGTLSRDAVAQVIDYTSALGSMTEDELSQHIANRSRQPGIQEIENFREWYSETIGDDGLDSLRPMRMFLVGLGVDATTERMVKFLAESSMDISLLTFHGFTHEGKILLARHVRVEGVGGPDEPRKPRRVDREANWKGLLDRAEHYGIAELFQEANEIFRKNWEGPQERARTYGLGFRLRGVQRSGKLARRHYARVDPIQDRLRVVFFDRAVELCPDKFQEAIKDNIPFDTYPKGRRSNVFDPPTAQVQFQLSAKDWDSHKTKLEGLAQAVYEALQEHNDGEAFQEEGHLEDEDDE